MGIRVPQPLQKAALLRTLRPQFGQMRLATPTGVTAG
jgi:hypothetical protein